jgi:hypothetical protein
MEKSILGPVAADFLTPQEQFMAILSFSSLVGAPSIEQQPVQRLQSMGNQYAQATPEQGHGNSSAAVSIAQQLQLQQQSQQDEPIQLHEPPSLTSLPSQEAGALCSGLEEVLSLPTGTLSAVLIQRLQQQTQQQMGAAAAISQQRQSNESSDEGSASPKSCPSRSA